MNAPEITPGKWGVSRYTNYHGFSISAPGAGCIAERWWPTEVTDIPIEANATLLAAAPALAEALHAFVEMYLPVTDMLGNTVRARVEQARAALLAAGYTEAK